MKKELSIIEVIQSVDPVVNTHLDSLNMGDTPWQEPPCYRNTETGEMYLYLAGGLAWPGKGVPGFVVVIAVGKMTENEIDLPRFTCLKEIEDHRIEGLLDGCLCLQERYGFNQSDILFRPWYADPLRFASQVSQFNSKLEKEQTIFKGLCLADPVEFQQPNHFEIYFQRICSLITKNAEGNKSLFFGKCNRLASSIESLLRGGSVAHSIDDCPAVFAVGSVVHSLMASTPWTLRTQLSGPTVNDIDDFETYATTWRRDPY